MDATQIKWREGTFTKQITATQSRLEGSGSIKKSSPRLARVCAVPCGTAQKPQRWNKGSVQVFLDKGSGGGGRTLPFLLARLFQNILRQLGAWLQKHINQDHKTAGKLSTRI